MWFNAIVKTRFRNKIDKAMKKFPTLRILVVLFMCIGTAVTAQKKTKDPILLTINGENITVSEFLSVYRKNNIENQVLDPKSLEEYLELYINFKLKVKEAEELGLDTLQSFRNELKGYRDQLAKPYFVDEEVNNQLLKQAYERKLWDIRASHILITVDQYAPPEDTLAAYQKIMEIRKRIVQNKEDFNEVAAEVSDDPSARDMPARGFQPPRKGNKGDLGYFSVFDMVYPFEEAAYNLKIGEVSMPVRTQFGYHLIKVTDKKPALGKVQVAHLFLQSPSEPTEENNARVKARIDSLYNALTKGANWDTLVKKFSDDKGSAMNGGILPWFGSNRMVPQFIDGIRTLKKPGDISKPVLTSYGWHIIKLIEHKPVGTFEEEKANLKQSLSRDSRSELARESVVKKVLAEAGYTRNDKALAQFYPLMDSSLYNRKWDPAVAASLNGIIATIGNQQFSQQEFAQYLAKNQSIFPNETFPQFVDRIFKKFIDDKAIEYLDAHLEEKYPEFKALVKEYRDGILLFDLTDQKVWSKAIKDTVGLRNFYENNRHKYMWDERADVIIFTSNTREGAEKALHMAKQRMSIDQIKEAFALDTLHTITITEKKYQRGENTLVDQCKWEPGFSDIMADQNNTFSFVLIRAILPPEPKQFHEARGNITADYQNYLEQEWLKELRGKYTVTVNYDVLSQIK